MSVQQEYIQADPEDAFHINIDPQHNFDYSPPFPHTPSYNGSYHNSPYSNHSELSFAGDQDSFALFEDEPAGAIAVPDYDPSEYDPPQSSLLMFNEEQYMAGPYDHSQLSSVPVTHGPDARPYDYSSPSSNGGGDSGEDNNHHRRAHSHSRSRASSISSNPQQQQQQQQHISPSPRMDVAQSFENMTFRSPNWGTDPLPGSRGDRPTSPNVHAQKPQSPPRLLMPDENTGGGGNGEQQRAFTPPTINAPEGDGVGPRLHIVPATPVSGGGSASTGAVPGFQSGLETLHQGTEGWKPPQEDEYARERYDYRDPNAAGSSSNPNGNGGSNPGANSPFLFGGNNNNSRQRRKSDGALEPVWDSPPPNGGGGGSSNFIGQMGNIGSTLADDGGGGAVGVSMNDVVPPPQHVSPHRSSFGNAHPTLNQGFSFGPPVGGDNGFLSPDLGMGGMLSGSGSGGSLRRSKSDAAAGGRMGHRGSRSEDLRLPSSAQHLDVGGDFGRGGGNQFLSPVDPPPAIRAAGRHAAGLGPGGGGHYRSASSGGSARSER
ncbi:hypothetical protein C8R46DRAFT_950112, partial [Mycena filopes]